MITSNNITSSNYTTLKLNLTYQKASLANTLGEYANAVTGFKNLIEQLNGIGDSQNLSIDIPYYYFVAHNGLGTALSNSGDESAALANTKLAIDYLKKSPQKNDYIAEALVSYGHSLRSTGDLVASENTLLEALQFARQQQESPTLSLAHNLNQLASSMLRLNKFDEALPYALEGLSIRQNLLPTGHMEVVASMGIVGNIYDAQSKFTQALDMRVQSLDLIGQTLGEKHPYYAILGCVVGYLRIAVGDYDQAISDLLIASTISEKKFSADHPRTANCNIYLGLAYLKVNDNQSAFDVLSTSVNVLQQEVSEDNNRLAEAEALHAIAATRLNITNDVDAVLQSALLRFKKTHVEDTYRYQRFVNTLSELSQ
ncbi:MAG: tetratricopeptide (TPR) repeat protein [Bermanella sp.]